MSWVEKKIGDIIALRRGHDLTQKERKDGEIPVYGAAGLNGYHNVKKANGPGLVIGRSGGSIGKCHFVKEDYWPHNTCLYTTDFKGNNPRFLYYFLSRLKLEKLNSGAAQPSLNRNFVYKETVKFPKKVETQNEIASILSTYDELIQNNQRRIELLEKSARLLYKEWFVQLRFPGHEHTKIVDGVPVGWERVSFSSKANFLNGFAFKPKHKLDEGLPIVKIPELRSGPSEKTPRNPGDLIPQRFHINDGDILFSWSGTLLVNIWNSGPGLLNQHLFKVTPNEEIDYNIVYLALKQALDEFRNRTVGSTMKHIRKGELESVKFLFPNKSILFDFTEYVSPVLHQIRKLEKSIYQLIKARDLLLPKLMNGDIPV